MNVPKTIPILTLTSTLSGFAKRAGTRAEKHYMFTLVESLGNAIAKENPGFSVQEFTTECGVGEGWDAVAA
jgi:hypothetical protein